MHDFELGLFQCTFLEHKHNESDKQYLDRYHWIDIELDPLIVQYPKPIKGYIKSIHPPSPNIMVSFHVSQLITAVRQTNVTKSELLKMVEEKFDGNNYFVILIYNTIYISSHRLFFQFRYKSAHHIDNPPSVARGTALGTEGMFVL